MKRTAIVIGLMMLFAPSTIGCKSSPKMAWWKSNKASESTAIAHQAPELPSDAAKQADAARSTQVAGGSAPPFTPGQVSGSTTTSGASTYPSTDAPAFVPSAVSQLASSTPSTTPASTSTVTSGPYNPAATPVAKAAPVETATAGVDRYGMGLVAGATDAAAAGYSATTETANNVANSTSDVASRYGMPAGGTSVAQTPGVAAVSPYSPAHVTPASSMVSTQPYRPGGTSTYSASVPSMASLPAGTTPVATPAGTATTPTSTAPASTPTNRYW